MNKGFVLNGTWEKNNATFFWTSILVVVCFFINMIMSNVRINRNYTSKLGTLIIGKKDMKFIHNKAFSPYLLVIAFMTRGEGTIFIQGGPRLLRKVRFCKFSKLLLHKSSVLRGARAPLAPWVPRP